jgi:hypothetical protein
MAVAFWQVSTVSLVPSLKYLLAAPQQSPSAQTGLGAGAPSFSGPNAQSEPAGEAAATAAGFLARAS